MRSYDIRGGKGGEYAHSHPSGHKRRDDLNAALAGDVLGHRGAGHRLRLGAGGRNVDVAEIGFTLGLEVVVADVAPAAHRDLPVHRKHLAYDYDASIPSR